MDYIKKDILKLYHLYFFENQTNLFLDYAFPMDINKYISVLSDFINDNSDELRKKIKPLVKLIKLLYKNKNENAKNLDACIKEFINDTASYKNAGIFAKEAEISDMLKNMYMFDLVEKIRFSKLQKESLRDTSSYNRHIEKSLTNMKNSLIVLFELEADYKEVFAALEKYYEFNRHVNTEKCWSEFNSLKSYSSFNKFLEKKNIEHHK
ncbi:MAG: hypothetical protein ACOWWH_07865 [Eubacteriaceae bacterium]